MYVGQPHVAAAKTHRQALVIDAEQKQKRRVQVVDFNLVDDSLVAEFVGFAVNVAGL